MGEAKIPLTPFVKGGKSTMAQKNVLKIRVFLWLILAFVLGWFGYIKIVPTGTISYTYDFTKPSFFIGQPSPAERVEISKNGA